MYIRDLEYYQQLILQKNFSKVAAFLMSANQRLVPPLNVWKKN